MVAMIAFLSENSILYRNYLTENLEQYYSIKLIRSSHGRDPDRMVVGFITTCTINAYRH